MPRPCAPGPRASPRARPVPAASTAGDQEAARSAPSAAPHPALAEAPRQTGVLPVPHARAGPAAAARSPVRSQPRPHWAAPQPSGARLALELRHELERELGQRLQRLGQLLAVAAGLVVAPGLGQAVERGGHIDRIKFARRALHNVQDRICARARAGCLARRAPPRRPQALSRLLSRTAPCKAGSSRRRRRGRGRGAPGPGASTMRLLSSRCRAEAAASGGAAPLPPLLLPELPPPQLPEDISARAQRLARRLCARARALRSAPRPARLRPSGATGPPPAASPARLHPVARPPFALCTATSLRPSHLSQHLPPRGSPPRTGALQVSTPARRRTAR